MCSKNSWMLCVLLISACGDSRPSPQEVQNLPPGDAVGSEYAGSYELEAVTLACRGSCAPVTYAGFLISPCDVGDRNDATALVQQTDGSLQVDLEDVLWASRLEGGVYSDGSFSIGGVKTELGGQIRFIAMSTGSLSGGEWMGDLELRSVGTVEGESRDCTATVEVSGSRNSP